MAGPAGRVLAALSLRARLLITLGGLLALVAVVAGVATRIELRGYLVDRLDSQLTTAGGRNYHAADGDGDEPARGAPSTMTGMNQPSFLLAPGQADGTLGASIAAGNVTSAGILVTRNGSTTSGGTFTAADKAVLVALATDGRPRTRSLPGLGSYRLVATRRDDGTVLVTGLPLRGVDDTISRLTLAGGLIAGGLIVIALLGGAVLIRLTLRPLRRVAQAATRVSELPLESGDVDLSERVPAAQTDPRTEVGQVGAAMNRMLDHVGNALAARQASEMRVRQFVADASHELRTPLASIRGYAELSRRTGDRDGPVPAQVAHALGRVESEAGRMTSLVEDLLLLARLDSGRPLAREEIDLTALLIDAVSDAHAAGPDHTWRLDLPADLDDVVLVTGDAERLHQVLVNLLANARTHTPPGTTVVAGLRVGDHAEISVVDDGPGIPDALQPQVFERFARGDTSRSRGAGSSGLGLAIVDAVVGAHGGTIALESRPGRTEFRVSLPLGAGASTEPIALTASA